MSNPAPVSSLRTSAADQTGNAAQSTLTRKLSYAEAYARFDDSLQQHTATATSPSISRRQFPIGSIFYGETVDHGSQDAAVDYSVSDTVSAENMDTVVVASKNDIFFQDHSVRPGVYTPADTPVTDRSKWPAPSYAQELTPLPSPQSNFAVPEPSPNGLDLGSPRSLVPSSAPVSAYEVTSVPTTSKNSIFDSPVQTPQSLGALAYPDNDESVDAQALVKGLRVVSILRRMYPDCTAREPQVPAVLLKALNGLKLTPESSQRAVLCLFPTKKNWLGEGRFANAYKASFYTPAADSQTPVAVDCVVKVPHERDVDAQMNALCELIVLRLLNWNMLRSQQSASTGIVRLLGVQNDAESDEMRIECRPPLPSDMSEELQQMQNEASSFLREEAERTRLFAPSLVLEYYPEGTLYDHLRRLPQSFGKRAWVSMCERIAEAVDFLHNHLDDGLMVLHLDIKPQNILLDKDLEPKLSDFGSATVIRKSPMRPVHDGLGRGTLAYTAPEMLTPPEFALSPACDVYSLGCCFYFLLTGREPFQGVTHPAHQMLVIRRGFWESGANPTSSAEWQQSSYTPVSAPVHRSDRVMPLQRNAVSDSSTSAAAAILRFTNGDQLHSDSERDVQAASSVLQLLQNCTRLRPSERWPVGRVLDELDAIDSLLILGTAF